jgi:hypothetical protein
MSVRSRINELIDSNNLKDAIKTVEIRYGDITTGDLMSIYTLCQKLIDNKQPLDTINVLHSLKMSSMFLSTSDFCSVLKNLLRSDVITQTKELIFTLFEKKVLKDSQAALVFIEKVNEKGEYDTSLDIVSFMNTLKIPLNERFWETTMESFARKEAVLHASQCLRLMGLPAIKSKSIWEKFISACLHSHNVLIAISSVYDQGLVFDKSLACEWWNLLLKKVVEDSEMPCFEICKILDKVYELGIELNQSVFAQSLIRLVVGKEESKIIWYLKSLKASVTPYVVSRLISNLIDMNLPREALEINNLVVQEVFGINVNIDTLEITNDKLKWILRHQQLQMIKFMKIIKSNEDTKAKSQDLEEIDEEEFVFL